MRCPLSISGRSVPQSTVSGNVPVAVAARIAPRIQPGGRGAGTRCASRHGCGASPGCAHHDLIPLSWLWVSKIVVLFPKTLPSEAVGSTAFLAVVTMRGYNVYQRGGPMVSCRDFHRAWSVNDAQT